MCLDIVGELQVYKCLKLVFDLRQSVRAYQLSQIIILPT